MNDDERDPLVTELIEDCVDYIADVVARSFEGVAIERYEATRWRPGLRFTLPAQCEFSREEAEEYIFDVRDDIFFVMKVFVAISVSRAIDE